MHLARGRMLRDLTSSGSLKKSSFFKKKFVLFLTKILLNVVKCMVITLNTFNDAAAQLFRPQQITQNDRARVSYLGTSIVSLHRGLESR